MTIVEIAKLAGVSKSTVSRAFQADAAVKPAVREKILRIAREVGYQPNSSAQALVKGISFNIGFFVASSGLAPVHLSLGHFSRFICELYGMLDESNYNLIIAGDTQGSGGRASKTAFPKMMREQHLRALIVAQDMWPEMRDRIELTGLPCVAVHCHSEKGMPTVNLDERGGIRRLTAYLIDSGHRRIAYLQPDAPGTANNFRSVLRPKGYQEAMARHSLTPMPGWDGKWNRIELALEHLVTLKDPPTAVILYDDHCACHAVRWLHQHGFKVPDDVSVVSCADENLGEHMSPPITRLSVPLEKMAKATVDLLMDRIEGSTAGTPGNIITFQPDIIEGESVKRVNRAARK